MDEPLSTPAARGPGQGEFLPVHPESGLQTPVTLHRKVIAYLSLFPGGLQQDGDFIS